MRADFMLECKRMYILSLQMLPNICTVSGNHVADDGDATAELDAGATCSRTAGLLGSLLLMRMVFCTTFLCTTVEVLWEPGVLTR